MSLPVYVDAYAGYKPNERPRQFVLDEGIYEIAAVLDQWGTNRQRFTSRFRAPKVRRICFDTMNGLTSGHYKAASMAMNYWARPSIKVLTVDADVIRRAEKEIASCEHCHPDDAEIPFDWILAEQTRNRGPYEFILSEPARCPTCRQPITEKTLVEPTEK